MNYLHKIHNVYVYDYTLAKEHLNFLFEFLEVQNMMNFSFLK